MAIRSQRARRKAGDAPGQSAAEILRLDDNLAYRLSMVSSLMSKSVARVYSDAGLSPAQWKILNILHDHQPMTAQAIAQRTTLDKAAISRTVQQLLKQGLILRGLASAHTVSIEIRLSAAGHRLYTSLAVDAAKLQARVLDGIDEKSRAVLFEALSKVEQAARRELSV